MSLKNTFNATVVYQLHTNPAILGLYSKELGYSEIALKDLKLTPAEIDALHEANDLIGTYEKRKTPKDIYVAVKGVQKSTWKVTSVKPA